MDESAVSSDPVTALLLDEKVVKDWCRRTFESILKELNAICILKFIYLQIMTDATSTSEP